MFWKRLWKSLGWKVVYLNPYLRYRCFVYMCKLAKHIFQGDIPVPMPILECPYATDALLSQALKSQETTAKCCGYLGLVIMAMRSLRTEWSNWYPDLFLLYNGNIYSIKQTATIRLFYRYLYVKRVWMNDASDPGIYLGRFWTINLNSWIDLYTIWCIGQRHPLLRSLWCYYCVGFKHNCITVHLFIWTFIRRWFT